MNYCPPLRNITAELESSLPAGSGAPAAREWDPVAALGVLLAAWKEIAALLVLSLVLAALALTFWSRSYTAESVVLLDPRNQPDLQLDSVLKGLAPDDQTISSEILVLRSNGLAAEVIAELGLAADPAYNPFVPGRPDGLIGLLSDGWQSLLRQIAGPSRPALLPPEAALESAEVQVLTAFADRLEVGRIGRSHAISIAVTAQTPGLAADIANAVAGRYLEGQVEAKFVATDLAQDWLNERVAQLQQNVEAAEKTVEAYRSRSGLIDSNGVTVSHQQMAEISSQLIAARAETAAARARLGQVQRLVGQEGDILSAAEVLSSPLIHRLKEQEVEVLRSRAELAQEYGPRHPRMLSVKAELSDIRGKIMAEVRQIVAGLNNEVAVAAAQEGALARDLGALETKIADQNQAQVKLRALQREAEASRKLLETFLERFKENSNQDGIQRPDARILSRALPPAHPSSPRTLLVLAAAAAVGLAVAIVWILLRSALSANHAAGRTATAWERAGVPVLAAAPPPSWWRRLWGRRATAASAQTRYGAAFARQIAPRLEGARLIAVSYLSGLSSEERFALELARFLARRGDLVLVVDAAEERHELLREWLPGTRPGLAELLADPELGPLATVPSGIPQLHLLPFGEAAYLPVPGADGLKMAMARMIAEFDRVVIITGAPKRESVAMHLCCGADRVILAGREEDLESTKFQEAVGEANRHRLSVAGLILTRTRPPYQGATR